MQGISESRDSSDKKLIFLVPISNVNNLSGLIKQIEERFPDFQIDIELNSLEDAYVKIAEDEIMAAEEKRKKEQGKATLMSPEEVQMEFDAYKRYGSNQSYLQKIGVIYVNRLRQFYRDSAQWFLISFPLLYVLI
jgi:hypothetical protein